MKDYAARQRSPRKHITGIGIVIAMHLALLWAINSGLARKFVKVIQGPVQAQLLEETKPDLPPPPPPPKNLPPPPPPAYVQPADIRTSPNALPATNAIAAVTNAPTPAPAPAPAPAPVSPPPAAPQPAIRVAPVINASSSCQKPEYPSASRRLEEEGTVQLRMLVDTDGRVIQAAIDKSSGYQRLDEAAREALSKCQFKPGTLDGKSEQAWATMRYTWRLE